MTSGDGDAEVGLPGDGLTIWAFPGLVTDAARPELGPVAALSVVPSMSVRIRDDHPGAELVDVIASTLLGQGFELVADFDPATLVELPGTAGLGRGTRRERSAPEGHRARRGPLRRRPWRRGPPPRAGTRWCCTGAG